jgi:hypothetical protein
MDVDTFPLTDALAEHGLSEAVPYEVDTASVPPRTLGARVPPRDLTPLMIQKLLGRKFPKP